MEQDRALRVLEFTKIREMLAQHAITEEGKQRCLELTPYHDLGDVNHALAETEEAVVLLTYLGQNPLVSYPDVRESIARAQKGACLSPRMLLDVSAFLRAARAARSALVRDRDDTPILTGLASRLTVLERVETDINDAILSEEEIADRASTELYQIRRQIRSANERMRDKLNQMIRSSSFAKISAGQHHHHAGRPLLHPGEGRVPGQRARSGPRPERQRGHAVYRAHVCGGAGQRPEAALRQGAAGDRPHPAGPVRFAWPPTARRWRAIWRCCGESGLCLCQGPAGPPDAGRAAEDQRGRDGSRSSADGIPSSTRKRWCPAICGWGRTLPRWSSPAPTPAARPSR